MLPAQVVSLADCTERRRVFAQEHAWLDFAFVDAVDGRAGRIPFLARIRPLFGTDGFSPGALGCLLSHRRIWKSLLASNRPAVLILEDDVRISRKAFAWWQPVITDRADYDVLFLGAHNGLSVPCLFDVRLFSVRYGFLAVPFDRTLYCTYGYVVSRAGAQKLLARTHMGCSVDYWHRYNTDGAMRYLGLYPNIACPSALARESSTQASKPAVGSRARLRCAVTWISLHLKLAYRHATQFLD